MKKLHGNKADVAEMERVGGVFIFLLVMLSSSYGAPLGNKAHMTVDVEQEHDLHDGLVLDHMDQTDPDRSAKLFNYNQFHLGDIDMRGQVKGESKVTIGHAASIKLDGSSQSKSSPNVEEPMEENWIHPSVWSLYGPCSVICGGGNRVRICSNPTPARGTKGCSGSSTSSCNTRPCSEITRKGAIQALKETVQVVADSLENLEKISQIGRSKRETESSTKDETELLDILSEVKSYIQNECSSEDGHCQLKIIQDFVEKLTSTFNKIQASGKITTSFKEKFNEQKKAFDQEAEVAEFARTEMSDFFASSPLTHMTVVPVKCSSTDPQFIPDVADCQKYYQCAEGIAPVEYTCPAQTRFSMETSSCDWNYNFKCETGLNDCSCFCEKTDGEGELCSAGELCQDGDCLDQDLTPECTHGSDPLEADCLCKNTNGEEELCAEGKLCKAGVCLHQVCTPGSDSHEADCFCENTNGEGQFCPAGQTCLDGLCLAQICENSKVNSEVCFCKGETDGGAICVAGEKCNRDGTCEELTACKAGEINSQDCFCEFEASGKGEVCSIDQGCTTEGTCLKVCPAGQMISEACFCQDGASRAGVECGTRSNQMCNQDGSCYDELSQKCFSFCPPSPHRAWNDCYCEGNGNRAICAAEQICHDGECNDQEDVTTEAPDLEEVATEAPDLEDVATKAPDLEEVATEAPDLEEVATEAPDLEEVATEAPDLEDVATEAPDLEHRSICEIGTICGKSSNEVLSEEIKRVRDDSVCMLGDVEFITPVNPDNPSNVKNAEAVVPESKFDDLFPSRHGAYTYENFLKAIGKFPSICKHADTCKKILANMFGHFGQETAGLKLTEEEAKGLYCPDWQASWALTAYPCQPGKEYYGRGSKQLSYNYNYGAFSNAMFGTPMLLLENPDLVATTWLNFASGMWFFVTPQSPKPSILDVVEENWKPNAVDTANGLVNGFGTSIMIINGEQECGSAAPHPEKAVNRAEYYKGYAGKLDLDVSAEQLSCASMSSFSEDGSNGVTKLYWQTPDCSAVSWQTQYQALVEGDFARCEAGSLEITNNVPEECVPVPVDVPVVLENWISSGENMGRCGPGFTAPSGVEAECDPNSDLYPCCSQWGWCNDDCDCEGCKSYSGTDPVPAPEVLENWISSGDNQGRCGPGFTAPSGVEAECDPNSDWPCCSQWGWCNNDCDCEGCKSYSVTDPVPVPVITVF